MIPSHFDIPSPDTLSEHTPNQICGVPWTPSVMSSGFSIYSQAHRLHHSEATSPPMRSAAPTAPNTTLYHMPAEIQSLLLIHKTPSLSAEAH
ncbi:hypothetical protein BJY00DRAFT_280395 [Aspergillus carlsbadensis]|nr:hypothetical protein BJY00DRAFT_280395 [Aspergillus carlsbadensis]